MARKQDSGWRDTLLATRHHYYGFECPAPGMTLPLVEYDRGEPLALISYIRRGLPLPTGDRVGAGYEAFGNLKRADGCGLPFITVQYDPYNWAVRMFPHNNFARDFFNTADWHELTEKQFVSSLYRLRGRKLPDLSPYGVEWSTAEWSPFNRGLRHQDQETWPGQLMSVRRRNYEPRAQIRTALRNPCVDIDFAVVDGTRRVAMVVDYKAPGARISSLNSTNVKALAGLHTSRLPFDTWNVPAFLVRYAPVKPEWEFKVHPANANARNLLSFVLGAINADPHTLASAIAGEDWVDLTEDQWTEVLRTAERSG